MPHTVSATSSLLPTAPAVALEPVSVFAPERAQVIPFAPATTTDPANAALVLAPPAATRGSIAPVVPFLASVGANGQNRTTDVKAVQQRLADLGFPVVVDGRMAPRPCT